MGVTNECYIHFEGQYLLANKEGQSTKFHLGLPCYDVDYETFIEIKRKDYVYVFDGKEYFLLNIAYTYGLLQIADHESRPCFKVNDIMEVVLRVCKPVGPLKIAVIPTWEYPTSQITIGNQHISSGTNAIGNRYLYDAGITWFPDITVDGYYAINKENYVTLFINYYNKISKNKITSMQVGNFGSEYPPGTQKVELANANLLIDINEKPEDFIIPYLQCVTINVKCVLLHNMIKVIANESCILGAVEILFINTSSKVIYKSAHTVELSVPYEHKIRCTTFVFNIKTPNYVYDYQAYNLVLRQWITLDSPMLRVAKNTLISFHPNNYPDYHKLLYQEQQKIIDEFVRLVELVKRTEPISLFTRTQFL